MIKSILLFTCITAGTFANARSIEMTALVSSAQKINFGSAFDLAGRFNLGDIANYNLSLAGMPGTMVISVKSIGDDGVWIDQNIDLMFEKEDIQELIDPATGKVKQMLVNGQPQTPPDPSDIEIISTAKATITVKAGTFDCLDVKTHIKSKNTDGEQWIAKEVPLMGLVQLKTSANGMDVSGELTSFKHGTP